MTDTLETKEEPTIEAKYLELIDRLEGFAKENAALKTEIAHRTILDELTTAARKLKIPESVVLHDLPKYCPDFCLKDNKVVLRQDETQNAATVLAALQKDRTHWKPTSCGVELISGITVPPETNNSNWF